MFEVLAVLRMSGSSLARVLVVGGSMAHCSDFFWLTLLVLLSYVEDMTATLSILRRRNAISKTSTIAEARKWSLTDFEANDQLQLLSIFLMSDGSDSAQDRLTTYDRPFASVTASVQTKLTRLFLPTGCRNMILVILICL